jgi:oxaloacetate decarboxylase gamma subunit
MDVSLVVEALKFMVLGMSVVLLFLLLMIALLKLQANLIAKFLPEDVVTANDAGSVQNKNSDNKRVIAAIIGAISQYSRYKN